MRLINGKEYPDNLCSAKLAGVNLAGADLYGADLQSADLHDANLHGANLYRANLQDANLHNTIGNSREIISLQTYSYTVTYTATHIQIGCKRYCITEWMEFDDDTINAMDIRALDWWTHHKRWIQDAIKMNPASSTPVLP